MFVINRYMVYRYKQKQGKNVETYLPSYYFVPVRRFCIGVVALNDDYYWSFSNWLLYKEDVV